MDVPKPQGAWLPSKLTLYFGKHKRALMVIRPGDTPAEVGATVLLVAKRVGSDLTVHFLGVVSKARKNYLEIRVPWYVGVSLAVYVGKLKEPIEPVEGGKIVIYDYLVQIEEWKPPLKR